MKAADVMVGSVVTVRPESAVSEAVRLLSEHDVSALPVVDAAGNVVGMLSEADLLHRVEIGTEAHRPWWLEAVTPAATLAGEFAKSHGRRVDEIMTEGVISVEEETPLAEVAATLERHRIKRVPVLRDGRLVGIVSRANLVQALASAAAAHPKAHGTDRIIRAALVARLAHQTWTDFGSRNVIVSDGVAHLWGLVGSAEERTALVALAEEVLGVVRVSDEMIAAY
jgi:CBS-domain-containing membrane protein